jgi:hypothetical protein
MWITIHKNVDNFVDNSVDKSHLENNRAGKTPIYQNKGIGKIPTITNKIRIIQVGKIPYFESRFFFLLLFNLRLTLTLISNVNVNRSSNTQKIGKIPVSYCCLSPQKIKGHIPRSGKAQKKGETSLPLPLFLRSLVGGNLYNINGV